MPSRPFLAALFGSLLLLLFPGCLSAPLPPADASLSATFQVEDAKDNEGVEVILPGTAYRGFTDRGGKIVFDHLPARSYELLARAEGHAEFREPEITLEAGDHIDLGLIQLVALPKDGRIAGSVGVENVEGATVEVRLLGTDLSAKSSPEGKFEFPHVPPGNYKVDFDFPGFAAGQPVPVSVEAGSNVSLAKVLLVPRQAKRLPKANTKELKAEQIAQAQAPPPSVKTKPNGEVPAPDTDPNAPGIVRGQAFYPDRESHEGIVVRIVDPPNQAATDPSGGYLLSDVPPGLRTLRAEADGYLAGELEGLDVLPGDVTTAPRMTLSAGAATSPATGQSRVYGQVYLKGQGPQPGTLVALEGTSLTAMTGGDGTFLLNSVPQGAYTLIASRDDYEPFEVQVEVAGAGDTPVPVITLEPKVAYMTVLQTVPGQNARKVEISDRAHVEFRMSEQVLPRTVRPSISVYPPVAMRVGTPDVDLISLELLRMGQPKVEFDTEYTVTISTGLQSTLGHKLEEPFTLTFKTGGPRILGTNPPAGSRDILLTADQPIVVDVNQPADLSDFARKIKISPNSGEVPNITQQKTPYGQRIEIQFQVQPNRRYRISLPRTLQTDGDRKHYENTPYKLEFRTGDYESLRDSNDEYLEDINDFLDR